MTKTTQQRIRRPVVGHYFGSMGYCSEWMQRRISDRVLHSAHIYVLLRPYNTTEMIKRYLRATFDV